MLVRLLALFLAPLFLLFGSACHHGAAPGSLVSAANSGVAVSASAPVVANGMDSTDITVTVVDGQGNPIEGARVEPMVSGTNNVLVPPFGVTDANGQFVTTLTSITAEEKVVTVRVINGGAVTLVETPSVLFIGDAFTIDAMQSTAEIASPGFAIADGAQVATVVMTVRDVNGNPVPDQAAEFAVTGNNNTLVQPMGVTDVTGVLTGTIASITAEIKTVTATMNPGGIPVGIANMPTVPFVGDVNNVDLSASSVNATPATGILADGMAISTIDIALVDINGNVIPAADMLLSVSGGGNVITGPGATDVGGLTSATVASVMAEVKTVMVSVITQGGNVLLVDQPTVEFVSDPSTISATLSTIVGNPVTVVANGTATTTVTVTVRDANGNGVAGQTVQLAATGTGNTLTQPGAVTDANGQASGSLASNVAEAKTLSATINPGPGAIALTNNATVTFAAPVSASMSSASATPTMGIAANGMDISTVTVTLRDAGGNLLPDRAVTLASNGTGNIITQPAALTDANGVTTATIASTIGETKTLTLTADPVASPTVLNDQPMVTFVQVAVDLTESNLSVSAPFGALADGTDTVTVTALVKDAAGNPILGRPVTLSATGAGNVFASASGMTDASGIFSTTLASTIAEVKTLTATVDPGPGEVVLNENPTTEFVWPRPGTWYVRTSGDDTNMGNSPLECL